VSINIKREVCVLRNNKGFSLIELMVVVAIIAILSTIAIPSYQSFQARSRQKEGFALLGAYFNAAQGSRAEYGHFPGDFASSGFAATGMLGYRLVAGANATPLPFGLASFPMCVSTDVMSTCPAGFITWTELPLQAMTMVSLGVWAPGTMAATTDNMFTAAAAGVVSLDAGAHDEYTINELKNLAVVSDGLK
jgi:type IV pilus assembly protein PilA